MKAGPAEAVIVGAEIGPGHDGSAELTVRLRYPNGGESVVSIDADAGFRLMRNCGVQDVEALKGQPWRRMLEQEQTLGG
jgi:hypothetical protein